MGPGDSLGWGQETAQRRPGAVAQQVSVLASQPRDTARLQFAPGAIRDAGLSLEIRRAENVALHSAQSRLMARPSTAA